MFVPGLTAARADPIGDQRQEAAQIAAQLEQLGNQSVTLGDQYEQALSDLDGANKAVADEKLKVAGLEKQVGTMRAAVSQLAVQSVVGSGQTNGGLGTLLGRGESITETVEETSTPSSSSPPGPTRPTSWKPASTSSRWRRPASTRSSRRPRASSPR